MEETSGLTVKEALKLTQDRVDSAPVSRVFFNAHLKPTEDPSSGFFFAGAVRGAETLTDVFKAMKHPDEKSDNVVSFVHRSIEVGDIIDRGRSLFTVTSDKPTFTMIRADIFGVLLHRYADAIDTAEKLLGSKLEPTTRVPEPEAVSIPEGPVFLNF